MDAKTNGALPAMTASTSVGYKQYGLTKRELFAAMAMQGILANRVYDPPRRKRLSGMAIDAVTAADELLDALAQAQTNEGES